MTVRVKEEIDERVHTIKCIKKSCGVTLEFTLQDRETLEPISGPARYGIVCPMCNRIIDNNTLMNSINGNTLWKKFIGLF